MNLFDHVRVSQNSAIVFQGYCNSVIEFYVLIC